MLIASNKFVHVNIFITVLFVIHVVAWVLMLEMPNYPEHLERIVPKTGHYLHQCSMEGREGMVFVSNLGGIASMQLN